MKKYLLVECRKGQIKPLSKAVDHLSAVVFTLQEKVANYYGYDRLQDYKATPEGAAICNTIIEEKRYEVDGLIWQVLELEE